jgi:sugar phosphate isomerase/epimerase
VGAGVLSRFGVVSDEIDTDPAVAFPLARQWGLEAVDLNKVWGKPVTDLDAEEVRRVRGLAERHGLEVVMVGGLAFKALPVAGRSPEDLLTGADFADHLRLLERTLQIARDLGARCARVHAFAWPAGTPARRPAGGDIPEEVLPTLAAGLRAACALAERYGLPLGLENVRACYANSGRNVRVVLEAVRHPLLQVVWDPANAYASGEDRPYPDGYAAVRGSVLHVHVKDARVAGAGDAEWACVGEGAVDWPGQLAALRADGYGGVLCLETHWRPAGWTGREATRRAWTALRALLDALA